MIATKQQMYRELQRGKFGNCLRNWNCLGALLESGYTGEVGVRATLASSHKASSFNNVRPHELAEFMREHKLDGSSMMINEGAPDARLVLQGEVMRSVGGLIAHLSVAKTKMRVAMLSAVEFKGIMAVDLLRRAMTPASYEDLMDLLDEHDTGPTGSSTVVEFSVYEMPLGHAKQRNTIVWECRNY